jgi:predicted secreted protein
MAATLGNSRKAYIGATSGNSTTYSWLTGEQSNTLTVNANQVEVSDKSTTWQKFIPGVKGATAEVTVFVDNSNAQQQAVLAGLHNDQKVAIFIGTLENNAPSEGDAFMAVVNSVSDTNDNGSVSTRTISLTADGAVTHYPTIS